MVAKKRKYKIELFPLLNNISTKNISYYDTMIEEIMEKNPGETSEDIIKSFTPFVLMRWLTGIQGADNARQILFLNEFVNPYAFVFTRKIEGGEWDAMTHKKLLYNLLTVCTNGRGDCRYKFIKSNPKNQTEFPISVKIIQEVFDYSFRDAKDALVLLTDETIIGMGEQLGLQKGEIANLKKELRKRK